MWLFSFFFLVFHNLAWLNFYLYMSISWKVHRLTKILSRNMIKWALFFSIVLIIYIYIYIYIHTHIIIIIIMSRYQHGYTRPSHAIPPYRPLLSADRQGYISYRHRAAVCRFELDVLSFDRLCEGVHRSISLLSSSLLLQQCPACLVRLIFIVFVMGGRWAYSCCFVGCCLQDLFNIACSILV